MNTPTPTDFLIKEQVDRICRSDLFDKKEYPQKILRFLGEQAMNSRVATSAMLAKEVWEDEAKPKTKRVCKVLRGAEKPFDPHPRVRLAVGRLRKSLENYYESREAQADIVRLCIPDAGVDKEKRQFNHYHLVASFRPEMLISAKVFARVLNKKYAIALSDGEEWFNSNTPPVSLLRLMIQQGKSRAQVLGALYLQITDDAPLRATHTSPPTPAPPEPGSGIYSISYVPPNQDEAYYFLLVPADREVAFKTALAGERSFDLSEYGTILATGEGEPPPELASQLRAKYAHLLPSSGPITLS